MCTPTVSMGKTRASICFERILFTRSRSNPYFYSYILLKFFRRSLFFKKGWKAPVNNHFAGQRLSAGIMAQRAAESFSVIFMWRQLGR